MYMYYYRNRYAHTYYGYIIYCDMRHLSASLI